MKYIEKITRTYDNRVVIEYEYVAENSIYIRSIKSSFQKEGNATKALQNFMSEFDRYTIYLCSTDEHGTKREVLNLWYEKLGFMPCEEIINNICVTHVKMKNLM